MPNPLPQPALDALRAVAVAATPEWGPAEKSIDDLYGCEIARHIATFDPPTALALLDEAVALRQEIARLREALPSIRKSVKYALSDCYGECSADAAGTLENVLEKIAAALEPPHAD